MKPIVNADVEKYLLGCCPAATKCSVEMEKLAQRNDIPIIGPGRGTPAVLAGQDQRGQPNL